MTTTCEQLTSTEAKALANIFAAPRGTKPEDFVNSVPATEAQVVPGDVVISFSRGNWRNVVVEKAGPKNVTFVYTTESAVKEAQERFNNASALTDGRIHQAAQNLAVQYGKNYDYRAGDYPDSLRSITAKFVDDPGLKAQRIADEEANWDAERAQFLAENPDRVAYIDERVAKYVADETARRDRIVAKGWERCVNFTRKSQPYAKVFVPKAGA
jgi:hypothetical protein